MRPEEFLQLVGGKGKLQVRVIYGTVTQASPLLIRWDGDGSASGKAYKRSGSYTPTLGDRVMAIEDGRGGVVVLDKIV